MPSGPGVISEDPIAKIAGAVSSQVKTFLLTSLQDIVKIIRQHQRCGTTAIQLVDTWPGGAHQQLRSALPSVDIVQIIHVTWEASLQEAVDTAPFADAILLDSGNPNLETR